MKILLQYLMFLIIISLFSANIYSQINDPGISSINSSKKIMTDEDRIAWTNSFYMSLGDGIPQGLRFEIGYNFTVISFGAAFGTNDNWSNNPEDLSVGIIGKLNLPAKIVSPYILFATGTTIVFSIFGGKPDTYSLVYFGFKIQLNKYLQLCPELGVAFTSKSINKSWNLFSEPAPVNTEDSTTFGFNLSLEIDL